MITTSESGVRAELEKLNLSARNILRSIEYAHTPGDRQALNKQLTEIQARIEHLKSSLR